jgi:hypothetical protein
MRLRLHPAIHRDALLEHLRGSGCLAVKHGPNEIEAHLLNSVSERHDREVLAAAVGSWQETHAQVLVEIVAPS